MKLCITDWRIVIAIVQVTFGLGLIIGVGLGLVCRP